MAEYNPRVLAGRLEDLTKELERWANSTKETTANALYQQKLMMEAVHRTNYLLRLVRHQFETDQETVSKTENVLDKLLSTCQEAQNIASETVANVRQALADALAALDHWQAELELALAWLARAQRRLELAQIAYNQALMELSSAQSALYSAESNLRACRNDDSRRSCWGEEAEVGRAHSRVRDAQVAVDLALREVRDAEDEVARAQARVNACTIAVNFSKQAVTLANEAEQNAHRALNFAERSMEFAQAALKSLIDAKHSLEAEEEAVNEMSLATKAATDSESEAAHHLHNASHYETSAQRYAYIAQQTLRQSVSHLWELNNTSLNESSTSTRNSIRSFGKTVIQTIEGTAVAVSFLASIAITQIPAPTSSNLPIPPNTPAFTAVNHSHDPAKILIEIKDTADEIAQDAKELLDSAEEDAEELTQSIKNSGK